MTIKTHPVDGLDIDVAWVGYDPKDWRNHPDPDPDDKGDDEDSPTPDGVVAILGFDPDDEDW